MKKYLLAAAAVTVLASPAYARDGQPYFGIEGGILFPKDQDADVIVDYTTTQTVATDPTLSGTSSVVYDNAFGLDYKKGLDVDAIIGYDFGIFRLEGELGWKRAKLNDLEVDGAFIDEATYLGELEAIADSGLTPADRLLEKFHGEWAGDIGRVFTDCAY